MNVAAESSLDVPKHLEWNYQNSVNIFPLAGFPLFPFAYIAEKRGGASESAKVMIENVTVHLRTAVFLCVQAGHCESIYRSAGQKC